jgi:hypothetical protein
MTVTVELEALVPRYLPSQSDVRAANSDLRLEAD